VAKRRAVKAALTFSSARADEGRVHAHLWLGRGGTRPDEQLSRPLRLTLAAAALGCAAASLHLASTSPDDRYLAGAAILCVAGLCSVRGAAVAHLRTAWLALAFASAALAAGRVPAAADAGQIGCYAFGGVALVLLGRERCRRLSWALLLDGVVTALTLAALVTSVDAGGVVSGSGTEFPLLNVLLLALVTVVAVWQGFRPSLASALVAAGLVTLALADANELGVLVAALLVAAATCVRHEPAHERHAPERWLAIVAPTALSFVDFVLLGYGRLFHQVSGSAMFLARCAFLVAFVRVFLSFVATQRLLRSSLRDAASDALTGLPNRRALIADAERLFLSSSPQHVLAIYDLDGFKHYNDTFGHDDGDTMLSMLGARLAAAVAGRGTVYRLGGDEFCLIAAADGRAVDPLVASVGVALVEEGAGFAIRPSYGAALVPAEASDLTEALRLADRRMYDHKAGRVAELSADAGELRLARAGAPV
jgi:diguanylate cyclase (GGDEF)-like protein